MTTLVRNLETMTAGWALLGLAVALALAAVWTLDRLAQAAGSRRKEQP